MHFIQSWGKSFVLNALTDNKKTSKRLSDLTHYARSWSFVIDLKITRYFFDRLSLCDSMSSDVFLLTKLAAFPVAIAPF